MIREKGRGGTTSRVCCYVLARSKTDKTRNRNGKTPAKWNGNGQSWSPVRPVTSKVTRTAGFMDAPYMHSHTTEGINQNDKATDFTSLWEEWITTCQWRGEGAAKQRFNERGSWGRGGTTALKFSLLLWQKTRGTTDGWGRARQGRKLIEERGAVNFLFSFQFFVFVFFFLSEPISLSHHCYFTNVLWVQQKLDQAKLRIYVYTQPRILQGH